MARASPTAGAPSGNNKNNGGSIAGVLLLGILLRVGVHMSGIGTNHLQHRMELATPVTGWQRVSECLHLVENAIDPYSGDACHETPLALALLWLLKKAMLLDPFPAFHLIADVLAGLLVLKIAGLQQTRTLQHQERVLGASDKDHAARIMASPVHVVEDAGLPKHALACYLLNPLAIALCGAKTSFPLLLLPILAALLAGLQRRALLASLLLAVATYQSLFSILLLTPVAFLLEKRSAASFVLFGAQTLLLLGGLLGASFAVFGSWDFLAASYGFTLSVPDLTPNLGFWWYFFTQMFQHFRTFFLGLIVLLVIALWIPISTKLKDHGLVLSCVLLGVIMLFKTYPSIGDTILFLSLVPVWPHVHKYTRYMFIVASTMVVYVALGTSFWYGWLYSGTGNANFVFAITLVWQAAQTLLVCDVFSAHLRYEFSLRHGDTLDNGSFKDIIGKFE